MRTGLMRRVVTLRSMTRTADGMGGYTETPTDVEGIPARVEPLEGREQIQAMATVGQRPHRFVMRYRSGMTGIKTLLYEGRTFDIKSVVDPEERHRELIILADEVNADVVTVASPAAPSGGTWGANEPAGMTLLTERPFDATIEASWLLTGASGSTANLTIETDATAPKSPGNVGRGKFPAGFASGGEPFMAYRDLPTWYKENYVCMAFKFSSNWVGNDSGVNKIIHTVVNSAIGGGNRLFYMGRGSGTGTLNPAFGVQGLAASFDAVPQGGEGSGVSANLLPNQPGHTNEALVRDTWYLWEAHYSAGTAGNADGFVKWWINNALVGSYINIPFVAAAGSNGWEAFQWAPTYGGAGSPVPAEQYQFIDHVVVKGKN